MWILQNSSPFKECSPQYTSVLEFISALQALAMNCAFGDYYQNAMKSRLIIGIKHNYMRQTLINTPNLTWVAANALATQQDQLRTQMRALAQCHAQAQANVNSVGVKPAPKF